jgi:glycerophosphoryl diester phosphodiesterase
MRVHPRLGSSERPIVIAHRGFSDEAPENTLAAFRKAIRNGAEMIELDVRLSSDNVFIVFHDKRLERTTDAKGLVRARTARELSEIDNGSWYSRRFALERVPLLTDIFPFARHGVMINIEIKPDVVSTNGASTASLMVDLLRRSKMTGKVVISSFNHKMMKEMKRLDEDIVTGLLYHPIKNFRRPPSQLATKSNADLFICSKYQVSSEVIADAHKAGVLVYVYGVTTERDVYRLYRLGVDGMIANNPTMVKEMLDYLASHR